MSTELVEQFPPYKGGGSPVLRGWRHRKTMTVEWYDGSVRDYGSFKHAVDNEAMEAELLAIWKNHLSQCDRRASFFRGTADGMMCYVPIAAGMEAMTVVRKYFNKAIAEGAAKEPTRWEGVKT